MFCKQYHTIQIRQRGTSVVFNWRSRSNTFVFRLCMIVSGLKLHINTEIKTSLTKMLL